MDTDFLVVKERRGLQFLNLQTSVILLNPSCVSWLAFDKSFIVENHVKPYAKPSCTYQLRPFIGFG